MVENKRARRHLVPACWNDPWTNGAKLGLMGTVLALLGQSLEKMGR